MCCSLLRPAAKQSTPWPELTTVVGGKVLFLSAKSMSMGIIFVRFLVFFFRSFISRLFMFLFLPLLYSLLDWVTSCYFLQSPFFICVVGV